MKLFDKLNNRIDYNNSYTLRRAISILEGEFSLAKKNKDKKYANEVLNTTRKIYEQFSESYRESQDYGETMSYMQKLWAGRLRKFISHLENSLNNF